MGKSRRATRPPSSIMAVRARQSAIARQAQIRSARAAAQRRAERIRAGEALIEIINNYQRSSGISGTVGIAANTTQAFISLLEAAVKAGRKNMAVSPNQTNYTTMATALLIKMPDQIFTDPLAAILLHNAWDCIYNSWPFILASGAYTVYCCVDHASVGADGNYVVVGVSTERHQLEKFKNDIQAIDFKISAVKTIQGLVKAPPSRGLPYPTIKASP